MFTPAEIATMPVAERVYYLQDQAAHVVARDEHHRLARIAQANRRALRAIERSGLRYERQANTMARQ